jgi:hypothetical protein
VAVAVVTAQLMVEMVALVVGVVDIPHLRQLVVLEILQVFLHLKEIMVAENQMELRVLVAEEELVQ